MQDIHEASLNESVKSEQSPRVVLWEIDLTVQGGERYFFCNELNEKGEPVTWQGREYQAYPIEGSGFEMNGKGSSARPSLTVSNLFGLVTGMAEDLQSLVGATVVRRRVYARFLDAVNFVAGNPEADPEQELTDRWGCLFYNSPRPRDATPSRLPSFSLKKKKKQHRDPISTTSRDTRKLRAYTQELKLRQK
ncbi:phage minor tail protein L, partial [Escherichia coli]|uniref:phage minor tail protein L n=1 Tax=Escherichia coli TaxID=562 RepID=UPI000A96D27E